MPTAIKKRVSKVKKRELPKPTKPGLRVMRDLMPVMQTMQNRLMQINQRLSKIRKKFAELEKAENAARKRGVNPKKLKNFVERRKELKNQLDMLQKSRHSLKRTIAAWERMLKKLTA